MNLRASRQEPAGQLDSVHLVLRSVLNNHTLTVRRLDLIADLELDIRRSGLGLSRGNCRCLLLLLLSSGGSGGSGGSGRSLLLLLLSSRSSSGSAGNGLDGLDSNGGDSISNSSLLLNWRLCSRSRSTLLNRCLLLSSLDKSAGGDLEVVTSGENVDLLALGESPGSQLNLVNAVLGVMEVDNLEALER